MTGTAPGLTAVYTIPEVAHLMGLSESGTYKAAQRGELPTPAIKVGGRWVVPRRPLDRLLGLTETAA